ncbi:MAG: hypothetical protein COT18_05525 [Elusimicrobia bacterium CG08_land_8_20_14_0_20_59_10]|nr:MAG: hypothetical protein COT18_05525 [Elusimicrobia bacterium CG08_land_8_20_14_0_20_59_10]
MNYFNSSLDYILFTRGFFLLLAAAAAFFLRKDKPGSLAWRWLAMSALAGCAAEAAGLAAYSLFPGKALWALKLAALALSYGLLTEFGRRSRHDITGFAPGGWIYAPLALFSTAGAYYGFGGLESSLLLIGGVFSGCYAGRSVLLGAKALPGQLRRPLTALGWLLAAYALFSLPAVPVGWLNQGSFFAAFGFPAQLPGAAVLALIVGVMWHAAFSIWSYSISLREAAEEDSDLSFGSAVRWLPLITVEALLAVILAAGWFGAAGLGRAERTALVRESRNNASILYFRMNEKLLGISQTAVMLAESPAAQQALAAGSGRPLKQLNKVLDRFQKVNEADVCYLMDVKGKVIASSNRNDPLSFVGDNYSFRPYHREAMRGGTSRYFALGSTTLLRGYYVSAPVADSSGRVSGVAAIKKNLDFLEEEMELMPFAFFVSPEGVVFLSGRKELLFSSLWTVSPAARYELLKSNQFGPLDFAPIWKAPPIDGALVTLEGETFYVARLLFGSDGWSLLTLSRTRNMLVSRFYGIVITFALCLLALGVSVILAQYRMRREEELELMRVREERRVLAGLLPVCSSCGRTRDDRDYKARVEAYMKHHARVSAAHTLCPDCARKAPPAGSGKP